jgi:penicillin-binding protein 1C
MKEGLKQKLIFRIKVFTLSVLKISVLSFLLFLLLNYIFPFRFDVSYSKLILDDQGHVIHASLSDDDKWRMKVELDEITPSLQRTIILKEDKYFWYHPGVNPVSVFRAIYQNSKADKRVSGASTITMQLARLIKPAPRTYKNKLIEMFRALQLEFKYSKKEILQLYLNLVPYGGNIEGVKSAAILYYDQEPESLSLAQLLTLSVIPNKPTSLRPGNNDKALKEFRDQWLEYFREKGYYSNEMINDALEEPLGLYRRKAPFEIPHLSRRLVYNNENQDVIHTSISMDIQEEVEKLSYNYINRIRYRNITNAAVIVVENKSRKVKAYMGSADFFDPIYQGQVDGVKAVRSPGSTLKPFLYALAMDKGMVTPASILPDVPLNIAGWSPDNYDGKFYGPVSVKMALSQSLNVPAVRLLYDYGTEEFIDFLIDADCRKIEMQREKLGLSVILGGCGMSLEELSGLYASLANGGVYQKLDYLENSEKARDSVRLISKGSSWMVTNILTELLRPDLPQHYDRTKNLPGVAWKTGTSYGRRDAWSIGYNTEYTVGVWVGNFPGNGVPELNGAEFATPLLFDVFHVLQYYKERKWFKMPDEVDFRVVCKESGLPPTDSCTNLGEDFYIPGVSSNRKCDHLKEIFVRHDERISYCRSCLPEVGYKKKLYPNLIPELIAYYDKENIPYERIPEHNPECTRLFEESGPEINSLSDGGTYALIKGESSQLKLSCLGQNDIKEVYWYIDDVFLGKSKASDELFFQPSAGRLKITCTDDKGRSTSIFVFVEVI